VNAPPVYTSKRTAKNLGQQYRIYPDRLELQSWFLFHTLIVPASDIEWIEVRPSLAGGFRGMTWGLKLDNADFCRHVLVKRISGLFSRVAFTPDNPREFAAVAQSILNH
jgi:hypothetical protein